MANTQSQIPVRTAFNNPRLQAPRTFNEIQSPRPTEVVEPVRRVTKKLHYRNLESKPTWRAVKTVYWAFICLVTLAETIHTVAMALAIKVNPLTAGATALLLYSAIGVIAYLLVRRLALYVAFGSLKSA